MLWHEHSWPEIAAADKQIPVVIPLGSCEQHGHHLPLWVDTMQVTAIAERVERELSQRIFLLPTLWLGCSEHHRDFPGTVSVRASLYSQMIKSVTRSVLQAGFRRVFFLNGHGGNETPGSQALIELTGEDDLADSAYLAFSNWWHIGQVNAQAAHHKMTTPQLSHACEYETSVMLAIRPELVHQDRAREGKPVLDNRWVPAEGAARVAVFRRFHRFTASGSLGTPSAATAEKGKSILDAVSAEVIEFLKEFATWPELKPLR